MPRMMWDHTWYRPGDWSLPGWWTNGPPVRTGEAPYTRAELVKFYNGAFVRNVLNHNGGITSPPRSTCT